MMGAVQFDLWISVDLRSERRVLEADELAHVLDEQLSLPSVYLEVGPSDGSYPSVTVSSNGAQSAIQVFPGEERVATLVGDGSVVESEWVDLPVDHELARFSGRFVMSIEAARTALATFIEHGQIDGLGTWEDL